MWFNLKLINQDNHLIKIQILLSFALHAPHALGTYHKRDETIYKKSSESKYHQKAIEIQNRNKSTKNTLKENETFFNFIWNDFC